MNENCSAGLGDEPAGSEVNQIPQTLLSLYEIGIEVIKQGQFKSILPLHHCLEDFTEDCPYSSSLVFASVKHHFFSIFIKKFKGHCILGKDTKGRNTCLPPRNLVHLG